MPHRDAANTPHRRSHRRHRTLATTISARKPCSVKVPIPYGLLPNPWPRQSLASYTKDRRTLSSPGSKRGGEHEATIRKLHAKIRELMVERIFLCAGCWSAGPPRACRAGGPQLPVVAVAAVRVAGREPFVAVLPAAGEGTANLALMRRLDELHLEQPFQGSRQMARHLRREGIIAGRHRVRRLMRLMGMVAVYRRPRTSAANPEHRVYPYLLRDLVIDRPDQVWCADITYIPVARGFLPRGPDGLGQPPRPVVAVVEHRGQCLLRRGAPRRVTPWRPRYLQHGPRRPSSPASRTSLKNSATARCSTMGDTHRILTPTDQHQSLIREDAPSNASKYAQRRAAWYASKNWPG